MKRDKMGYRKVEADVSFPDKNNTITPVGQK